MSPPAAFNGEKSKILNGTLLLLTVFVAWFTLLFDLFVLFRLTCAHRVNHQRIGSASRRIGVLHSKTTYVHLIGNTLIFLFVAVHTPSRDRLWSCQLINFCFALFTAGVYGSSLCQSLFRYWRITQPNQSLFRQYSFHRHLCIAHWISLFCLSIPICLRSLWIPADQTCFHDFWSIMYISFVCVIPPVIGNLVIYIKVMLFLRENCRNKVRVKNTQRNASIIRRILFLLVTLLSTSASLLIVCPLVLANRRLVALTVEIDMLICSVIFVVVSPQIRKILKFKPEPTVTNEIRASITSYLPPNRERNHAESISFETEFNLGL